MTVPKNVTVDNGQLRRLEKQTADQVRENIRVIRSRLDSVEKALDLNRQLNELGELQQLGPRLDSAIASLSMIRRMQRMAYDWEVENQKCPVCRGTVGDHKMSCRQEDREIKGWEKD